MYSAYLHRKYLTILSAPYPLHSCVHHFTYLDIYRLTMRCRGGIIKLILIQRLECNYVLTSQTHRGR